MGSYAKAHQNYVRIAHRCRHAHVPWSWLCSGRYAEADNKYIPSYDASEQSSYLMYFDVNYVYGWAMCQPFPYGKFQWVEDAENFYVSSIAVDSPTGYILEVDTEYPHHLHDAHADLPFCPARAKPPGKRQDKLLATLYDKQRYVVHYRNLQQCSDIFLHLASLQSLMFLANGFAGFCKFIRYFLAILNLLTTDHRCIVNSLNYFL